MLDLCNEEEIRITDIITIHVMVRGKCYSLMCMFTRKKYTYM